MVKRIRKHELPNTLGKELKRQRPADAAPFDPFDDSGRDAAPRFEKDNERLLAYIRETIAKYAAKGDGDSLILLDTALLASCQAIRDYIGRVGVTVVGDKPKHGGMVQ